MEGFIYIIQNKVNQKVYVGVTVCYENRWSQHILSLRKKNHHSLKLQRAWNKYGEENFSFEVIERCDLQHLYQKEIDHILELNSYKLGYNNTKGGKGGDYRPIKQFDKFGNFIEEFLSITQAANKLNITHTNIWKVCNKINITAGDFQWRYVGEEDSVKLNCKPRSLIRKIYQYSIKGEYIAGFSNAIDAAKVVEKHNNKDIKSIAINIRKCCRKQSTISYNFQWRFYQVLFIDEIDLDEKKLSQISGIIDSKNRVNNGKKIAQLTEDQKIIQIYSSVKEIKEKWLNKFNAISQCLQGHQAHSHGFQWKYINKEGEIIEPVLKKRDFRYYKGKRINIKRK